MKDPSFRTKSGESDEVLGQEEACEGEYYKEIDLCLDTEDECVREAGRYKIAAGDELGYINRMLEC